MLYIHLTFRVYSLMRYCVLNLLQECTDCKDLICNFFPASHHGSHSKGIVLASKRDWNKWNKILQYLQATGNKWTHAFTDTVSLYKFKKIHIFIWPVHSPHTEKNIEADRHKLLPDQSCCSVYLLKPQPYLYRTRGGLAGELIHETGLVLLSTQEVYSAVTIVASTNKNQEPSYWILPLVISCEMVQWERKTVLMGIITQ